MFLNAFGRIGIAAPLSAVLLLVAACGEPGKAPAPAATPKTESAPAEAQDDQETTADRVSVDSESLPYAEVGEVLIYGYFAFPSDMIEPLPAVLLIHDLWGLDDETRGLAERIAAQGYMVLAVDLYGAKVGDDVAEARQHMISVIENPDRTADNIRQALAFVGVAGAPSKASLGFGLGGTWSLNTALRFPEEIDAAVVYYGQLTSDERRLADIDAPVLGLFGGRDRRISIDSVTEFETVMRRLGKNPTVQIYADAGHAFADSSQPTFDAETASDAWQRTMDFLAENLSADDS